MIKKDEEVLVVSRRHLPDHWLDKCMALPASIELASHFNHLYFSFLSRNLAEADANFKQLIPYIIVKRHNEIAIYQRNGSEKRLAGLWSIGVGGHVNTLDGAGNTGLEDILLKGARRELLEEFSLDCNQHGGFTFLGIINEELSEVGKVHLGIVLLCSISGNPKPDNEISNLQWIEPEQFTNFKFELWSELALKLYPQNTIPLPCNP